MVQYESAIEFAEDAPGYGPLVSKKKLKEAKEGWEKKCKPALEKCYDGGSDEVCMESVETCVRMSAS
jgi:hypothetical protein